MKDIQKIFLRICNIFFIMFFFLGSFILYFSINTKAQTYNNITDIYTFQNDNNGFSVCNFATTETYLNNVFGATDSNAVGISKQYLNLNTTYFEFNATVQIGKYFNLGLDTDNFCSGINSDYVIQINSGADFVYIGNNADYHICYLTIDDILSSVSWKQNKSFAQVFLNNSLVCSYNFITEPDGTNNYISLAIRDIESFIDNVSIEYNKYKEPCYTNFSCNNYGSCIIDKRYCNSVIDLNNCSVEYTGNYSEFEPLDCCIPDFKCNKYTVCSNETFKPSCNIQIDNNFCGSQNCTSAIDLNNCGEDYLKNCTYNNNDLVLTNDASLPLAFVYSWYENVPYNNEFCAQFFKVNESKILNGFTFITGIINNGGNITFHLKKGFELDYSPDLTKGNIFIYPEWSYYNAYFDEPYLLEPNISYYIFLDVNEENETVIDISAYGIDYNTNPDYYIMCNVTSINTIYNLSNYIYTMNLTFDEKIFCGGNFTEFKRDCNLKAILICEDSISTSINRMWFFVLIVLILFIPIALKSDLSFLVSSILCIVFIMLTYTLNLCFTTTTKGLLTLILALFSLVYGSFLIDNNKSESKHY